MSEIAIGPTKEGGAFNARTMLIVVAVGILAFVATLVLGAYAPDLRNGNNGGAHALSNGATGFSGLVRLAEATDRYPYVVRSESDWDGEELLVMTPDDPTQNLTELLQARASKPTLLILPKWRTSGDPGKKGWVRSDGTMPTESVVGVMAPDTKFEVERQKGADGWLNTVPDYAPKDLRFRQPRLIQTIAHKDLHPILTTPDGKIVLGKLGDKQLYVLADPDLLNNHGMADIRQARAGMALLDFLNSTDSENVSFDVVTNGLGKGKSPLKLAFDPPFLSVTVAIFVALLLAGLQALFRFGAPVRPERAIAFGKRALIDNSAALVRRAGRESRLGPRYLEAIRERLSVALRLPTTLKGEDLDQRLDQLAGPRRPPFTLLAEKVGNARSGDELLSAARDLNEWTKEISA